MTDIPTRSDVLGAVATAAAQSDGTAMLAFGVYVALYVLEEKALG